MKPLKSTLKTSLALLGLGLITAGQTQAAIVTWSGASGANWSTNSSWTGSVPPTDNTTTDTAQFTVDTSGTVNLSAPRSVAALDIQRDTTFSGSSILTLNGTAGVTNLTLAAGKTAVFNNPVVSGGGNRTLGSGSTLTFNGSAVPTGGIYNMTAATVNFGGYASLNNNPLFRGTGTVNYTSTTLAQGALRFAMDGVDFTFKSTSVDPTSASQSYLEFAGTTALNLERNVDFTAGTGSATVTATAQSLGVGFAASANNKATTLTISGAYQAQFNQLLFGVYNGNTISLDGSTLLISGYQKQGVFLTDVNGGQYNAYGLNTYTITSTANGGTVRVGANATSSFNKDTSATSNYGATLLVSGNATLINNGAWTNKNYTTNTTYTGLQVNSTATLGGNGSFDMSATAAGTLSAKNAIISGTVAPGDGGIGTLTINGGNVTLSGTAKYELGTAGVSHGSPGTSDRLVVSGALTLGGTLNLIDNAGANGNGSAGAGSYQIFTQTGAAGGSFTTINNIAGYHAKVDTATSGSVFVDNYQIASANTITTPVDLGKARVGGTFGTSAVSIQNTAASNGYAEGLNATKGAVTGGASLSGTNVSNLAGGSSSTSILLGLANANMTTSGSKTGNATIDLASNGTNSGYSNTSLTSQVISVSGMVYDYAQPVYTQTSGNGTFGGSGTSYTLDFGTGLALNTDYIATINLANNQISLFQDALGGSYAAIANGFSTTATTFSSLTAGSSNSFTIKFNTASSGTFNDTLTFSGLSEQSGLSDGILGPYSITLSAVAVPEPSTWLLLAGGLTFVMVMRRRRV